MYVAITRAEKRLFLTDSGGYNFSTKRDKTPSRFILEIKKNLIETDCPVDEEAFRQTKTIVRELNTEISPLREESSFKVGAFFASKIYKTEGKIIKNIKCIYE